MKRRKKPFIILAVILVVVLLVAGFIALFVGSMLFFNFGVSGGQSL